MDYGTLFLLLIIFVIIIGMIMYYMDHKKKTDPEANVRELRPEEQEHVEPPSATV